MNEQQSGTRGTAFLGGLILGLVAGATAATLLAPAPGERTRKQLADQSRDLRQRMERMARDMQEGLGELAARLQPAGPGPGKPAASPAGPTTASEESASNP